MGLDTRLGARFRLTNDFSHLSKFEAPLLLYAFERYWNEGDVDVPDHAVMLCAQHELTVPGWLRGALAEQAEQRCGYVNQKRGPGGRHTRTGVELEDNLRQAVLVEAVKYGRKNVKMKGNELYSVVHELLEHEGLTGIAEGSVKHVYYANRHRDFCFDDEELEYLRDVIGSYMNEIVSRRRNIRWENYP